MRASKQSLEKELLGFLGPGRDSQIAARYYGFDGRGGRTLLNVGEDYGLTRERVRQIVEAVTKRLGSQKGISPTLDRTITSIANSLPAVARDIEAQLKSQGLTMNDFRIEGVMNAAALLGKPARFVITKVGDRRIVHTNSGLSCRTIFRVASRLVAHLGIANVSDVVFKVRSPKFARCDANLIAIILSHQKGFAWLDRSAGWFCLSDIPINPLLNRIRKILSVAKVVDVSELSAGVARDYRMDGFSPPNGALLEFCRRAPGLSVRNSTIKADQEIDADQVLTQSEKEIRRILAQHGGTLARHEVKSMGCDIGINRASLFRCLLYSPIISEDAPGLYRLVGSEKKTWYYASDRHKKEKQKTTQSETIDAAIFPSGLLLVNQVSTILGISPRAVHYHANSGALKGDKIGPTWHFQIRDVYDFKAHIDAVKLRGLSRIRLPP